MPTGTSRPLPYPPPPPWASDLRTVGVTGTNGKSTTATWLARALREHDRHTALVTTLGAWVGEERVPIGPTLEPLLDALRTCHLRGGRRAVLELTSAALSAGFMRSWPCRVGVFTNLGLDHLDVHGSVEHYLASKAQLFVQLPPEGAAVLNAADETSLLLEQVIPAGVPVFRYGAPGTHLFAGEIDLDWTGTTLVLDGGLAPPRGPGCTLTVGGIGAVFAANALAALLGAYASGVPIAVAARALGGAAPPAGRFERVAERPDVVVDYAHTPDALIATLGTARALARRRVIVVLGAGGGRQPSKRGPMGAAVAGADRIIVTTDNPRDEDPAQIAGALADGVGAHAALDVCLDRARAIEVALAGAEPDDLVLLLGKGHERTTPCDRPGLRGLFTDAEIVRHLRAGLSPGS